MQNTPLHLLPSLGVLSLMSLLSCASFALAASPSSVRWICSTEARSGLADVRASDRGHGAFRQQLFLWNMVLDESGLSRWNWRQNSLFTVDRKTETVIYNPEFYAMKHFSATVLPGAHRIAVTGGPFKEVVAFQNPDGSRVLIIENNTDHDVTGILNAAGSPVRLNIPAQSMNTLILRSSLSP